MSVNESPAAAAPTTAPAVERQAQAGPSFTSVGLFVLAIVYTLYLAADFLIPIAAAGFLYLLLMPVLRLMVAYRIPHALASGVLVIAFVLIVLAAFSILAGPMAAWLERGPDVLEQVSRKLELINEPVEKVEEARKQVEKAASVGEDPGELNVTVREPGILQELLQDLQTAGVHLTVTFILLYFLLATTRLWHLRMIGGFRTLGQKKRVIRLGRQVGGQVARYLFTVTLINIGLGIVIGLAMFALGVPNAQFWGVMAALLNFIPYIGAVIGTAVMAGIGLLAFDTFPEIAAVPATYFLLTAVEGYLVTPTVLGRSLLLNPVAVFLTLIFWGWIWGVPGLLMAVPLLVAFATFCEHVEALKPVGAFLMGDRRMRAQL